jgi:membrane-bound metal-dependent hydrolase YbcI (DUF457 family)
MSFPPAHMLVGAGLAELAWSAAPVVPRWRAWAVCAAAAVLPDVDMLIGYAAGRGFHLHGTFTHSLSAVVLCTLLVTGVAGLRWGLFTGMAYGSHLLVDLLDSRGPTNVTLGWPFSHARSMAIEPLFPTVPVEAGHGGLVLVESIFTGPALRVLMLQTGTAAAVFAGLCALGWTIRRIRDRGADPVPLPS